MCSSSMYSFHLFLISSVSPRSLPFMFFIVPVFGQNTPLLSSVFLKRSLVFPPLLFSSSLIYCSWKRAFSLHVVLRKSAFIWIHLSLLPFCYCFFSCCKAFSDNHFALLFFFFFGMVLFTSSCTIVTDLHP